MKSSRTDRIGRWTARSSFDSWQGNAEHAAYRFTPREACGVTANPRRAGVERRTGTSATSGRVAGFEAAGPQAPKLIHSRGERLTIVAVRLHLHASPSGGLALPERATVLVSALGSRAEIVAPLDLVFGR